MQSVVSKIQCHSFIILLMAIFITACYDESSTNEVVVDMEVMAGGEDGGMMAGGEDGGMMTGGEDGGGENGGMVAGTEEGVRYEDGLDPIVLTGCDSSKLGQSTVLMPDALLTQIHPTATWDGEAFWFAWNIPNEESKFETWAGRFDCDLNMMIEPFAVDQVSGMNDIDPSIAVNGDTVLIAWARDNSFIGEVDYNLTTHIATYHRVTGEQITPATELRVKTIEAGHPTEAKNTPAGDQLDIGNRWMVNVATNPDGGFILSGSWGDPDVNSFRAYVVHLNEDGLPQGSAWLADPAGRNHNQPVLSVSPRGHIDLVWGGDDANGRSGLFIHSWRGDRSSIFQSFIDRDWSSADVMRYPHLGYEEGLNMPVLLNQVDRPWVVGSNNAGQVTLIDAEGEESGISGGRQPYLGVQFAPKVITGYQRVQGTQHKVWRRPIGEDRSINLPEELSIDPTVAPYPLSMTHFKGGSLYLWSEGENPNFLIRASLIAQP